MMVQTVRERTGAQTVEPGAALIVPLVGSDPSDQGRTAAVASRLLTPLAGRFAAKVAAPLDAAEAHSHVVEWIGQAARLLLLPFSQTASRALLLCSAHLERALEEETGEQVSRDILPAPDGTANKPVFAPLEGVASAQAQLTPLLRLFSGWPAQYLCLSSSTFRLVLFCDQTNTEQSSPAWKALAILDLLEMGFGMREGRWKNDGEIFLSYMQSLVGGVLRGPALQCADTLQSSSSLHLLTPPWRRCGGADGASEYKNAF